MSTQANEKIVRSYYEDALTPGNWALLETLVAEHYVEHEQLFNLPPTRAGLRQKYELLRSGFPDLQFVVEDLFAAGDKVAARVSVKGSHTAPFMGRTPTGRSFAVTSVGIFRIDQMQIVEHWGVFDQFTMLMQLGALPVAS